MTKDLLLPDIYTSYIVDDPKWIDWVYRVILQREIESIKVRDEHYNFFNGKPISILLKSFLNCEEFKNKYAHNKFEFTVSNIADYEIKSEGKISLHKYRIKLMDSEAILANAIGGIFINKKKLAHPEAKSCLSSIMTLRNYPETIQHDCLFIIDKIYTQNHNKDLVVSNKKMIT